jgi:hypothetical protein
MHTQYSTIILFEFPILHESLKSIYYQPNDKINCQPIRPQVLKARRNLS